MNQKIADDCRALERAATRIVSAPRKPRQAAPMAVSAISLVLPWALVLHDNHRFVPARGRKGLVASPEYRTAKRHAEVFLAAMWGPSAKLTGDIRLHAACWFPDKRKRDAGNYRKLITDALSGIVYADDSQLVSETWERAGFDKDHPSIIVTLTPIP